MALKPKVEQIAACVATDDGIPPQQEWGTGDAKMRELPITLPSLQVAIIKVPECMNELDFSTLVNTVSSWKDALVKPPEPAKPIEPAKTKVMPEPTGRRIILD